MKDRKVVALALVAVLIAAGHLGLVECQPTTLSSTFYATTCPNVDQIVRDSIGAAMNGSQIVGPSVLRLFAHDCFVGGCDGSILLQDTSSTSHVERDFSDNLSLQQASFDAIDQAKAAVEAQCPGVVSCADVLVMASQDAVSMMGGPSWTVLLGRRDGLNSTEASAAGHLPGSDMDVKQLMGIFSSIGLSTKDLVTLSGSHTVGFAHCKEFTSRLYNFNNVSGASDPSLTPTYLATLRGLCPNGNFSNTTVQALDPTSSGTFDNGYYRQLQIGQGLLFSDQVIFVDNTTTNLVTTYANNQAQFFKDFVTSMIAMSQVGVLTGAQGEIRLNCSAVNSGKPVPPGNSTTPPSNATAPAPVAPIVTPSPPPVPVVTPSPPPVPVVTPSPHPVPVVTPSPPPVPVVTPSPPPVPVVTPSPPPVPVVPASPPPVSVVTPSPPPAPVATASPPPAPVVTASPPPAPVVTASPPPVPVVTPSPPPAPVVKASPPPAPVVTASPPPTPVVTASPPPAPVVAASPPPIPVTPASPPPVPKVTPSPPPNTGTTPSPGGRRRF